MFVTIVAMHLAEEPLHCFGVHRSCIIRGLLQGEDLTTMQESFHHVEPEARTFVLHKHFIWLHAVCYDADIHARIACSIPLAGSRGKMGAHECQ